MGTPPKSVTRRIALFVEATIVLVLILGAAAIWVVRENRLEKNPQAIAQLFEKQDRSPSGTAYWKSGSSPIPIVFVPGMFASKALFSSIRPHLSRAFTVYGVDLAGFGYTPSKVAEPSLSGWTNQLKQFLVEMQIGPAVLVGQGEGSDVIQALAERHPELVRSLVLIAHSPGSTTSQPSIGRSFLSSEFSPVIMRAIPELLLVRSVLKQMGSAPNRLSRAQLEELAYPLRRPRFWKEARRAVATYKPGNNRPSVPVDVIYGINDSWSPLEPAKKACDASSQCRFHLLMDAGHLPTLEQPQAFSRLLIELFAP